MSQDYPSDWDSRRKRVYRRDNYTCQNCGRKGGPKGGAELHAHHGVPLSKGGTNKMENLTTYCKECHNAIHNDSMAPTHNSGNEGSSEASLFPFGFVAAAPPFFLLYTFEWYGLALLSLPVLGLPLGLFMHSLSVNDRSETGKPEEIAWTLFGVSIVWSIVVGLPLLLFSPSDLTVLTLTLLVYGGAYAIYKRN